MTGGDEIYERLAARIGAVSPEWRRSLARHVSAGRRAPELRRGLSLAVETIYEGYALHFATPRTMTDGASTAMRLLVGDWCYAAGLCDVAEAGDLEAVATLADLIADVAALAQEAPRPDDVPDPRDLRWSEALADLRT